MDREGTSRARENLVEHLRENGEISSDSVARAMATVPRHEFVPEPLRERAYEDVPLDIGNDQVVTAPHLVARMAELLDIERGHSVLEVGTGSGYHAAVLAELAGPENVVSIERFQDFAVRAQQALARTGYGDVSVVVGDGSLGLPEAAPFDRMNVAAVAPDVPTPLLDQLGTPGRMVIPLGPRDGPHELELLITDDGAIERSRHGRVRFVPLVGAHGFDS